MAQRIRPYGEWESPIDATLVAEADGRPNWIGLHAGRVHFTKPIPAEGGRVGLFTTDGEVLGAPWNVRNRVHEYGGCPWTSVGDTLVFTNWDDQRLYAVAPGSQPRPVTAEPERHHGVRYTDLRPGPDSTVWCVRESVTGDRPTDVARDVIAVPLDGAAPTVLVASHHFLSTAVASPDGRRIAWLGWDHPAMPWDGTALCVAELDDQGSPGPYRVVAGGPREAVCQFAWADGDTLLALTDPTGWWNLHRVDLSTGDVTNLGPADEECGGALWQLGAAWFAPLPGNRFAVLRGGRLAVVDGGVLTDVPGLDDIPSFAATLAVDGDTVYGVAAGPKRRHAVVAVSTAAGGYTALTPQPASLPDPAYLSVPDQRVFTDAEGNRIPAHVYPPTNPDFAAPDGDLAPYVVTVHGGPTGSNAPVLSLENAYFTSRGIGVVAVDYGGSTGNGRAFRERLNEQWGVVDVADCAVVAEALAAEGTADRERLAIRGGSAGGYTAALAIATTTTYRAATVMFPVIDLLAFAEGDTHDFESRYTFSLVGTLPGHEQRYRDRSPGSHTATVAGPVLLLQGLEDRICPPEQARAFSTALDGTGIPHAYLTFEGEQHGFRKSTTIVTTTEAELAFYGQVFGFTPPGVEPVDLAR